jgi:hypothetical protein
MEDDMNFKICIGFLAILALGVASAFGAIGWAGQIWPTSGQTYLPTDNIGVYVQVWKDGCTGPAGPCADLTGWLYYKTANDALYDSVAMTYNVPIGNNDELTGTIPALATQGGVDENFYVRVYDSSDDSWYDGAQDQNGNDPPFTLHIQEGTSQDVTVTFRVDVACLDTSWYHGLVYFTGDGPGWNWAPCDPSRQMSDPDGDLIYEGQFTFPGGSNPSVQYKYNDDNCNWESIGNRSFTIDDSSPTQVLPIDIWDNWDCCTPIGPSEITGPGSFCITPCFCDEYLDIPLNVPYDPPIIPGILFESGCDDLPCATGAGLPTWEIVALSPGQYVLRICMPRVAGNYYGCYTMTIDQILPVELSTFEATPLVEAVRLDWSTASEKDNSHFVIERSSNSASWTEIAEIPGSGTSQTAKSYSYTDQHLLAGTTYQYRLSSVDIGGTRHTYDRIVSATPYGPEAVAEYRLTPNYPNPFNPTTSFSYTLKAAGLVKIRVFDMTGGEVATLVNESQPAGVYSVTFDGSKLPSGIYVYRIETNGFTAAHKMVLLK